MEKNVVASPKNPNNTTGRNTLNVTNNGPNRIHVYATDSAGSRSKKRSKKSGSNGDLHGKDLELDDGQAVSESGNFILGIGQGKSINYQANQVVVIEPVADDETFE